ncbi:MAG: DUF488 domain-containing protein [Gammaproteobacteria bacterium]|nr:DUF488 domain-containing protein [Gammaproteobacteria bacterium]
MSTGNLHIKRVYDTAQKTDGCRILVDRVWPRGMSKQKLQADLWLRDAAPSTELRRWFGHDPDRWDEFRRRYFAELRDNPDAVAAIRDRLDAGTVTLLYSAKDTRHNQAAALQEYLCPARES